MGVSTVSTLDEDAVKRRQRAQQVALFRYQLIGPALEPGLSTKQRGKLVRGIAAQSHDGPFGGQVSYSQDTLDRWIRRYRAGGFDALSPSIRQAGTRIDGQVSELAAALKRENPGRTAAQVKRPGSPPLLNGLRLSVEGRVVGLFELHRGHHSKDAVQAPVVVPIDPADGGVLYVTDGPVWAAVEDRRADALGLVEADHALHQCVDAPIAVKLRLRLAWFSCGVVA